MHCHSAVLACLAALTCLPAQSLGGGAAAPNGEFVRLDLESWVPGARTRFSFSRAPSTTSRYFLVLSVGLRTTSIPGFSGSLMLDLSAGRGFFADVGQRLAVTVPANLAGRSVYVQGALVDRSGAAYFTDATKVDFFEPVVLAANAVATPGCPGYSISIVDLPRRSVAQTLPMGRAGVASSFIFTKDRRWAYANSGAGVLAIDLSSKPFQRRTLITVSGGRPRFQNAISRDSRLLFVPVNKGISVVDIDPKSTRFHTEIRSIPTPIQSFNTTGVIHGPAGVAIGGLKGDKLYVCYGQLLYYHGPTVMGVIDLSKSTYPHRSIGLTSTGTWAGISTREWIRTSPDGVHVYTVEVGLANGTGYAKGGVINVVNTLIDREIAAVPTFGYLAGEMCIDRAGRNIWVTQFDKKNNGEILQFDVDPRRKATRHTVLRRTRVGTAPFPIGFGVRGIDTTPDGSTACFVVRYPNRLAEMWTLDTRASRLFGTPVRLQCHSTTLAISQF